MGAGYLSDVHLATSVANRIFPLFIFFVRHDYDIKTTGIYSAEIWTHAKNPHFQLGITMPGKSCQSLK